MVILKLNRELGLTVSQIRRRNGADFCYSSNLILPTVSGMPSNQPVNDLFEKWRMAFEKGNVLSVETFCADQPELAAELSRRISAWKRMNQTWQTEQIDSSNHAELDDSALTGKNKLDLRAGYRELRHLATGGIGVVYQATDITLDRRVAIKTQRCQNVKQDAANRFAVEARITAGLDHPGVVPVYAMGQTDSGDTFYVMRMVQGETMGDVIENFHQSHDHYQRFAFSSREFHDLLGRFAAVCKTIAYAHSRGIIHCDIKPRNILFGRYGETIVLDWGAALPVTRDATDKSCGEETIEFALSTDSDSGPTKISGTLPYMSPEQAAGSERLTKQSDVFSLGVTLYAILTGRTPYTGSSSHEIRKQIIRADYQRPRKLIRKISPAIESICLKAMASEPEQRYQSAMELAEDVERFLADESISGIQEPIARKTARLVRRNRNATLIALIGVASLMLLTLAFSLWQTRLAQQEKQARRQGLGTRAALAADSIRYELDRRIWALESAARDPKLRKQLQRGTVQPVSDALFDKRPSEILEEIAIPFGKQLNSYCWFLNANDGHGTQIGRYPLFDQAGERFSSLGKPYARREYFHGQMKSLSDVELNAITPIHQPHISTPFRGTQGEFVVAISVPVFSDSESTTTPIGVIGMAVRLGDITAIGRANDSGDFLVIGNLTQDHIDGETGAARGLIMHHPVFQHSEYKNIAHWVPRLTQSTLEFVDRHNNDHLSGGNFLPAPYVDPTGRFVPEFAGKWLASEAIVGLPTRLPEDQKLGWMVILQERY
jgi:serine/threonine protein kinase